MSADGFDQPTPDRENPGQHGKDQQGGGQQPEHRDEPQKNADVNPEKNAGGGQPPDQSEAEATRHLQDETKHPFPSQANDTRGQGPAGQPGHPGSQPAEKSREAHSHSFTGTVKTVEALAQVGMIILKDGLSPFPAIEHALGQDANAATNHGTNQAIVSYMKDYPSSEPQLPPGYEAFGATVGAKPEENPADTEGGNAEDLENMEAYNAMREQDGESSEQGEPTSSSQPPYGDSPGTDTPGDHDGLNREMRRDEYGRTLDEARAASGQWFRGQRPR